MSDTSPKPGQPYATDGATVSQSPLTGHWIVDYKTNLALGFRRWEDAHAEAQERTARWARVASRLSRD